MKMKNLVTFAQKATLVATAALLPVVNAVAEEATAATTGSPLGPIGAGLAIGLAVIGGGMGQGKAVGAMLESFGRNPSVGGKLLAPMLIGMALIESLVILAFVVALKAS
jgi:F-type H+-transporting ATPase subunit c